MALALAQYEDLFQVVRGYLCWRKNGLPNWVQDNLYSYVYSCEGYMALALAQYEDLFQLVRVYLY